MIKFRQSEFLNSHDAAAPAATALSFLHLSVCPCVRVRVSVWFTITAFYGAVVWYSLELKENGTDPHLITVNSPLIYGPLSDARPITTNTTSHHLQGPRVFRCAFMIKPFALKRLLRKLRPVLRLAVPRSGAGWRAGPSMRVHWTSPFSIKCKIGVLEYVFEKTDMISDYTVIVNTVVSVAL